MAVALGNHLLETCDRFITDVNQQRIFVLKFLFVFDHILAETKNELAEAKNELAGTKDELAGMKEELAEIIVIG